MEHGGHCQNVLFIRHLPSCLRSNEKEDLLKYFGAKEVRIMPSEGRLKNTAFATFEDAAKAKKALSRLHQVEILNCILCAEYAKASQLDLAAKEKIVSIETSEENTEVAGSELNDIERVKKHTKHVSDVWPPIAPHFGLNYPANPGLLYKYPSPNPDILINICSALLTVPKLYTQVLHLMNKMSLVPPFTPAASVPPMLIDHMRLLCGLGFPEGSQAKVPSATILKEPDYHDAIEMSESESEYETDNEQERVVDRDVPVPERVMEARKRKAKPVALKDLKTKMLASTNTLITRHVESRSIGEVFAENAVLTKKGIDIKFPLTIDTTHQVNTEHEHTPEVAAAAITSFGSFAPTKDDKDDADGVDKKEDQSVLKDYITMKQLDAGRLSSREIAKSSLYKNYRKGEPTCRLYIKNLHKRVTEKDLEFIFGRFVDLRDENEKNMFDVRLMTRGKMKGQAFAGLPSIESATQALKATNGYQLIDKPMIVQFARSAKPKT